ISENLRDEIRANPALEILGDPTAIEFQAQGDLVDLLTEKQAPEPALAPNT
ncbi:MAG: hypothetical protein HY238_25960, partial [Acidobacteria bacterium]|nr:hypothetical protein [Acidobacteriota bacterium]